MAPRKPKHTPQQEQPFMMHLVELRTRLLRMVLCILLVFAALFPFTNQLYSWLAEPLIQRLPSGASMIATEVASPFLTPFKFVFVLAIAVAMPFILHQVWRFIAPGLYRREKRIALPLLVSSIALFYSGISFAYFVVFPLAFRFLIGAAPQGVTVMTDISKYLDFTLTIFFAFGLAFEVPVAIILMVWAGITTPAALARKRSYVVVAVFVIGAVLTPPDVISQTLLAVPMWLLFELGLFFSRVLTPQEGPEQQDAATESAVKNEDGNHTPS